MFSQLSLFEILYLLKVFKYIFQGSLKFLSCLFMFSQLSKVVPYVKATHEHWNHNLLFFNSEQRNPLEVDLLDYFLIQTKTNWEIWQTFRLESDFRIPPNWP